MAVGEIAKDAEALVSKFRHKRLLNQDQAGRRIVLYGSIQSEPALLLVERAPFANDDASLTMLATSLSNVKNLGANDIYYWFMAGSSAQADRPSDLKINMIYPCTEKHIKKYSQQGLRVVEETPEIYRRHVRPYMQKQREEGRLNWIFNILDGITEQEDVIYRESGEEGFLLLPDLNWDRKTISSLHLLGLVERRDIWSLRDLTTELTVWLRHMRQRLLDATVMLYPGLEADQLKLYIHYQPTYYHFHIHVVHVSLEAGATQAVGKAFGLENVIAQLDVLKPGFGMADISLTYHVGEASEMWTEIFQPLKQQ